MLLPEGVKDWGSASREAVSIFDETQLRRFDWKTFLESGKVVLEGPKISSRPGPLKSATGRPCRKMQVGLLDAAFCLRFGELAGRNLYPFCVAELFLSRLRKTQGPDL